MKQTKRAKQSKFNVPPMRGDDVLRKRDEAPLGSLQYKILAQLERLGTEAYAYKAFAVLMQEAGHDLNPASVYSSIIKMESKGFVERGKERYESRGPAQKILKVTPAGREALRMTKAYYKAMYDY
jgi:DNA-binding PadR family transcriptional regulator